VAESNAANCRARATKEATSPQLQFRQKLAQQMLMNRINDDGVRRQSPLRVRKRGRDDRVLDHGLVARPNFTGGWSNSVLSHLDQSDDDNVELKIKMKVNSNCRL
jgi:hypothetical protein